MDTDVLLEAFGRLHPLVLHLPIGLFAGALVLEVLCARGRVERGAMAAILWLAALSAVVSASAGWVLAHQGDYGGEVLARHQRLGIAVAISAVVAALLHGGGARSAVRLGLYRLALGATCALLVPTGHLGSVLTHGADWLVWPWGAGPARTEAGVLSGAPLAATNGDAPADETVVYAPAELSTYEERIAPILRARCTPCHGASKHKGALRLDSPEGMLEGGTSGPALVAGDVLGSYFLERASLPLEHEDHMPPEGKPQPTAEDLATLRAWVAAGAPFEGRIELAPAGTGSAPPSSETSAPSPAEPVLPGPKGAALAPADPAALAALAAALVHVERQAADSELLWIDVAAVAPTIDDAALARLLEPLREHVVELGLARSAVTDASLELLARCPRLARLDLSATAVTEAGLARLAGHAALEELALTRTHLGEGAVDALFALPGLQRVALWRSGLSEAALARLAAERPALAVDTGADPSAEPLESEGELAFTNDRPFPGETAVAVPAELRAVNATCPVSGKPVQARYSVVFEGRVIGFCCPNCPKDFWSDPSKFADKLH